MNLKTIGNPLPDMPSELITVALADLEKCEQDPRYEIDMGIWHQRGCYLDPVQETMQSSCSMRCGVCLAGSVMAQTIRVEPDAVLEPDDFGGRTQGKLRALDLFRMGSHAGALSQMGLHVGPPQSDEEQEALGRLLDAHDGEVIYEENPEEFKLRMRALAEELNHLGL